MNDQAPGIPEAPREPRWSAALRASWPLGLAAGLAFCVLSVTGLVLWTQAGGGMPFSDYSLDSGASIAEAQITRVRPAGLRVGGREIEAVSYLFEIGDGRRRAGISFAPRGRFQPGTRADVEFLPADPDVHRLAGAKASATSFWLPWFLGWLWLPSVLLLLFWLRRVWRVRSLLRQGGAAVASVTSARPVALVRPAQLRVAYSFADRNSQEHRGAHWVPAASPLGQRLRAAPRDAFAAVVYDELQPRCSRLAAPEDFLPQPTPGPQ